MMTAIMDASRSYAPDTTLTPGGADKQSFMDEAMPHLDVLYRYALSLTGDEMYADDLVQETMLKAYRSWHQFRPGTNARAWLLTILRNHTYQEYRKVRRQGVSVDIDRVEPYLTSDRLSELDPERFFADSMVDHEVTAALERLPDPFREAFHLTLEGLDYQAIAQVLAVPLGTVKSRISRARTLLRESLLAYAVREGFIRSPASTSDHERLTSPSDVAGANNLPPATAPQAA